MEAVEYNCERYRSMSGECPMCNCLLYSEASLAEGYANKVKTFENSMTSGNSVEALKAASDLIMTIIMLSINKISTEPN